MWRVTETIHTGGELESIDSYFINLWGEGEREIGFDQAQFFHKNPFCDPATLTCSVDPELAKIYNLEVDQCHGPVEKCVFGEDDPDGHHQHLVTRQIGANGDVLHFDASRYAGNGHFCNTSIQVDVINTTKPVHDTSRVEGYFTFYNDCSHSERTTKINHTNVPGIPQQVTEVKNTAAPVISPANTNPSVNLPVTCSYGGNTISQGSFQGADGCSTCTCNSNGQFTCDSSSCNEPVQPKTNDPVEEKKTEEAKTDTQKKKVVEDAVSCNYHGNTYKVGNTFSSGCNSCTCGEDGSITCTEMYCESPDPVLDIWKTNSVTNVSNGDVIEYQITVKNISSVNAYDIEIFDRLPALTDYVYSSDAGEYHEHIQIGGASRANVVTWPEFDLGAYQARTFIVKAEVASWHSTTLTNYVFIDEARHCSTPFGICDTAYHTDYCDAPEQTPEQPVGPKMEMPKKESPKKEVKQEVPSTDKKVSTTSKSENKKVVVHEPSNSPVLSIEKYGSSGYVVGENVDFVINYKNLSNYEAKDVYIIEVIPTGTQFDALNHDNSGWKCDGIQAGSRCEFHLGNLDPSTADKISKGTVLLSLKVTADAGDTITNKAAIEASNCSNQLSIGSGYTNDNVVCSSDDHTARMINPEVKGATETCTTGQFDVNGQCILADTGLNLQILIPSVGILTAIFGVNVLVVHRKLKLNS